MIPLALTALCLLGVLWCARDTARYRCQAEAAAQRAEAALRRAQAVARAMREER